MSSTQTPIRARRESAARRSILRAPTTSLLMRMSSTPPSTSASASDTFWQQTPTAPACICRRAMSGHLCVLAWVRTRTRPATARFKRREIALEGVQVEDERRGVDVRQALADVSGLLLHDSSA